MVPIEFWVNLTFNQHKSSLFQANNAITLNSLHMRYYNNEYLTSSYVMLASVSFLKNVQLK